MTTKERLAAALIEANAPQSMVQKARVGYYDDFESTIATPIVALVHDCRAAGLNDLAARAVGGDFDASKEESEAWFEREGKELFS